MANRRQIPFLHWQPCSDGTQAAHWKPSPRLRKLGWKNRKLGIRHKAGDAGDIAATAMALELNRQVEEWQDRHRNALSPKAPRRHNFTDLVTAYRASPEYENLAQSTRSEYESRLRFLVEWALDGRLPLSDLDSALVRDLKTELLANKGSLYRAGGIMRVLRLLLNWAVAQSWIPANPADRVSIPSAPSRGTILLPEEIDRAATAAYELGYPSVGLGFVVGLWTLQRQSDLLAANRMMWRPIDNVAPADAAVLTNVRGDVMGLRLRQKKTGAWVDCPLPPFLHADIEAAFDRSQWLLPDDSHPDRACPPHLFQRRARMALRKAGLDHAQFRDTRRSGMTMLSDLGAELPGITAISGHAVLGRKTILDTYMPGNTRAACAAMATALRTMAARERKEESNG